MVRQTWLAVSVLLPKELLQAQEAVVCVSPKERRSCRTVVDNASDFRVDDSAVALEKAEVELQNDLGLDPLHLQHNSKDPAVR